MYFCIGLLEASIKKGITADMSVLLCFILVPNITVVVTLLIPTQKCRPLHPSNLGWGTDSELLSLSACLKD